MKTQSERVLDYLKKHSKATSNELRDTFHIVDIPKVIDILHKKGHNIQSTRLPDGTAEYALGDVKLQRRVIFEGNVARVIYE